MKLVGVAGLSSLLQCHETVLVTGPTGCGKSTEVPVYLLNEFPSSKILMTLPRRLAVSSLLSYIEEQTDMSIRTEISLLMARCNYDSPLSRFLISTAGSAVELLLSRPGYYDIIILDEIHEMSSEIVQLLVICSEIQVTYGTKIVLMSATVEDSVLSGFKDVCIYEMREAINSACRLLERPMEGDVESIENFKCQMKAYFTDYKIVLANAVEEVALLLTNQFSETLDQGDILVFVPGISDFKVIEELLSKRMQNEGDIQYQTLFVHSKFSNEQKSLALRNDSPVRTVIVSTNICETSLTLPTVSFVVDTCLTKEMFTEAQSSSLRVVAASNEALIQRAGRVGRCKDGCYIPCFTKEELAQFPAHYVKEDVLDGLPTFILEFLAAGEAFNSISMDNLLDRYAMTMERGKIYNIMQSLEKNQLVLKEDGKLVLTEYGRASEGDIWRFACDCLGIYELGIMILSDYQPGLNIFIDEFEIRLNQEQYLTAAYTPALVKMLAYMEHDNSYCKLENIREINNEYYFNHPNGDMMYLQVFSGNYSGFSEMYANSKIVALWRSYFPIPTQIPTEEEILWCRERLLNYEALRQFELNVISGVTSGFAAQLCRQAELFEQNMSKEIYAVDLQELEEYFKSIKYDCGKINAPKEHKLAYEQAVGHFGIGQQFCVTRLLNLEKQIGIIALEQLLTSVAIVMNNNASFVVEPAKYKGTKQLILASGRTRKYAHKLEFDISQNVLPSDLEQVFEKKYLAEGAKNLLHLTLENRRLTIYFNCTVEQMTRLIFALYKEEELEFTSGSTMGFKEELEYIIDGLFKDPPPLLPSALNRSVTLESDEQNDNESTISTRSNEKDETSRSQERQSQGGYSKQRNAINATSPSAFDNPVESVKLGNVYQNGAVFIKNGLTISEMQPYLEFDNFAVMTYSQFGSSASRHFIAQCGFVVYLSSLVLSSSGRFAYSVANKKLSRFAFFINNQMLYHNSAPDVITGALILCIHHLTTIWAPRFGAGKEGAEFSHPKFCDAFEFDSGAIKLFTEYKESIQEFPGKNVEREAMIEFMRAFGGIQDQKYILGCSGTMDDKLSNNVLVYVCK